MKYLANQFLHTQALHCFLKRESYFEIKNECEIVLQDYQKQHFDQLFKKP